MTTLEHEKEGQKEKEGGETKRKHISWGKLEGGFRPSYSQPNHFGGSSVRCRYLGVEYTRANLLSSSCRASCVDR
eukprot:scaffold63129_cov33-Tisochrysis_lutea.AAC.2